MTALRTIDLGDARRLAIAKQRLSGRAPRSSPSAVLDVVRAIRCVQLDPISVVARSPLLVLRSRLPSFRPEHLDRLLWTYRTLFEYWAHAASIVLSEDYPIHRYQMRTWPRAGSRFGEWAASNDALRRSILREVGRRGPLRLRDLDGNAVSEAWVSTGWTRDRNVDQMVRFLWVQGKVMVSRRRGLEKWWDRAERVLPAEALAGRPLRDAEVTRRAAELSLRGLGVATPAHIKGHFTMDLYPGLLAVLERLQRSKVVEHVELVDDGTRLPGTWYVHRDDLPLLERIQRGRWEPRTTLLSPFDNLLHDRKRSALMFGLDYRMEIYVPKANRRYGYYAMPLLDGDRFLARVDPALDRERGRLLVHTVTPEDGVRADRASAATLAGAVHELAGWLGAEDVEVTGPAPSVWRRPLG
ncbi:MAG TPA: crosslink repair DNA glycosylase YcaQ family protein [Actinomycetota bacterium]|nr:crosslink repair DNA glycosylase YcaQ family protein [Actinomycetota bacterium]